MKDKVGTRDQISFVLNGQPVQPKPPLICAQCDVDRAVQPCPKSDTSCLVTTAV